MCWCWSEHPYHRPEFKEVISKLKDAVTSQLVTAFPISNADSGTSVAAAYTRSTTKSFASSSSALFSGERRLALAPGYLDPFGNTNKMYRSSFKSPVMVLDVWCGGKDGLKHITSQTTGHMTEVLCVPYLLERQFYVHQCKLAQLLMDQFKAVVGAGALFRGGNGRS